MCLAVALLFIFWYLQPWGEWELRKLTTAATMILVKEAALVFTLLYHRGHCPHFHGIYYCSTDCQRGICESRTPNPPPFWLLTLYFMYTVAHVQSAHFSWSSGYLKNCLFLHSSYFPPTGDHLSALEPNTQTMHWNHFAHNWNQTTLKAKTQDIVNNASIVSGDEIYVCRNFLL